jgi:ribosomal protein L19
MELMVSKSRDFMVKTNFCISNLGLYNLSNLISYEDFKVDREKRNIYILNSEEDRLVVGNPVSVAYRSSNNFFSFEGLCVLKRFKSLKSLNSTIGLRAKINGVGTEVIFFFWLNFGSAFINYFYKRIQHYKYGIYNFKKSKLRYSG